MSVIVAILISWFVVVPSAFMVFVRVCRATGRRHRQAEVHVPQFVAPAATAGRRRFARQ